MDPGAFSGPRPALPRNGIRPDGGAGSGRARRALRVRRRRRGRQRADDSRTPARGRRGLLHRRARRQSPRLDVAPRGASVGLACGKGRRAAGRADAAPRPAGGPRLAAGARARGPRADRAGLDGHSPHDVELRRAAALRAAIDRAGRILGELQDEIEQFYRRGTMSDELLGVRNGVQTALAIHRAASDNRVSRGCHYRVDG